MGLLPILSFALQALAAEDGARALSVREVMENSEALHDRQIVVSGWIQRCHRLSCPLYASRREARSKSPEYWLSIGSSRWFDAFARRKAPTRVTLRARFDSRCVADPAEGVIIACADRVRSLDPISVVE